MSIEPKLHTAVFNGKKHTLTTRLFSKIIGRSVSFVSERMLKAEAEGIESPMQYAINESERLIKAGKVKILNRSPARISPADSIRMKKEARFKAGIQSITDKFLYPVGVQVIGKREGYLIT